MNEIYLTNAKFKVNETGRQKVLKEKRKNVHAFIEGELKPYSKHDRDWIRGELGFNVTYNPYKYNSFVIPMQNNTASKVNEADYCYMNIKNKQVLV